MLFLIHGLFSIFILFIHKAKYAESKLLFNIIFIVLFSLFIAFQAPGISADYFNYLRIYNDWDYDKRFFYLQKYEYIFVFIFDISKSFNDYKIFYLLYGGMYSLSLSISHYFFKKELNLTALYILSFFYFGLSANVLSGVRYIFTTFLFFNLFTIIYTHYKFKKPSSFTTIILIVFFSSIIQLAHQTGVFLLVLMFVSVVSAAITKYCFTKFFSFPVLLLIFIIFIIGVFVIPFTFVYFINIFNLPYINYSSLFLNPNIEFVTTINIMSRMLWVCCVLYICFFLPRSLSFVHYVCFYILTFFTLFYVMTLFFSPLFRMSNMCILVGVSSFMILLSLVPNSKLITNLLILGSIICLAFRVYVGGGEYSYSLSF